MLDLALGNDRSPKTAVFGDFVEYDYVVYCDKKRNSIAR